MILTSIVAAVVMDLSNINPVRALYWSAVINGVLAPFILVAILIVASDKSTMMNQPSSTLSRTVVGLTTILMFIAAVAMFVV